jgi:hypothetical protein
MLFIRAIRVYIPDPNSSQGAKKWNVCITDQTRMTEISVFHPCFIYGFFLCLLVAAVGRAMKSAVQSVVVAVAIFSPYKICN